jgi:hypothetical protein
MCRVCGLAADLGAKVLVHGSPGQHQRETGTTGIISDVHCNDPARRPGERALAFAPIWRALAEGGSRGAAAERCDDQSDGRTCTARAIG